MTTEPPSHTTSPSSRSRYRSMDNFFLFQPKKSIVQAILEREKTSSLSYKPVGATDKGPLDGWDWHSESVVIGSGPEMWSRAILALQNWSQFDMSWVFPYDRSVPLEVGQHFAFVSRQIGVWCVNVCRVVYTVADQIGETQRFGFAYGTLASHAVRGEELFLLEWDHETDEIRFSIRKF